MTTVRKLIELMSPRERVHFAVLFALVLVMAFLEMLSVASVLPFLSVAADPSLIQTNGWLSWIYESFGFASTNGFLLALAGGALLTLVLSNVWLASTQWAQIRFSLGHRHKLSVRLLRHYLDRPYAFFLQRHSADLSKNILGETDQVTNVLRSLLRVVTKGFTIIAILGALLFFEPLLAVILTLVLGSAYGLIYGFTKKLLTRLGRERVEANKERYQLASEAFGAIKDVKLLGRESSFLGRFAGPSKRFSYCEATSIIIGVLPKHALEVVAFGGVLVIAIYMLVRGQGLEEAIPVLGFYAFAGYRLMPSLQQVFANYAAVLFGSPALETLHRELVHQDQTAPSDEPPLAPRAAERNREVLRLERQIELDGVTFTYQNTAAPVLQDVTLSIDANSVVGIVGSTGSGKTTLVDLVLGLLQPQSGEIRIDGTPLHAGNIRAWRNGLGYVPQHIFLTDDTIARNIAFGVPDENIDRAAIERAARIANIHDFIVDDLADGYDTPTGERGVRLSGGQRQRIGIARALYHDPGMLVFDEATSALDNDTEAAVMEAINELAGTRTILMIAHRLTTLDACQILLRVRDGRVWTETRDSNLAALNVAGRGMKTH
jgi:ATP-binding cassette subfamily C protein